MTARVQPRTVGSLLDNHIRRIRALEALDPSDGCCPGEWIIPTLLNDWVDFDADCPFMYRWGPFVAGMDVNDAGIEFSGQITGGASDSVAMTFPAEDLFDCDKDFAVLVFDGVDVVGGWAHIESSTGDMTVSWPFA